MINNISKISKIQRISNPDLPLKFNSSLPISIEVLKELPLDRYKLLLGNREFTTKSQKKLKEKNRYWGNFGKSRDGIITISNLKQMPTFMQDDSNFLDIEMEDFLENLKNISLINFKQWIMDNLEKAGKKEFKIFATMLLALKNEVIHLPFKKNNKLNLVQIKNNEFYMSFENLGPIRGIFENQKLKIDILFSKSLYFLSKKADDINLNIDFSIKEDILPLFEIDKLILDLKG
ncbi:hypothetical protein ACKGJI_04865 [Sulfurospirillum sp. 1307]|jgi:hypothetical protein